MCDTEEERARCGGSCICAPAVPQRTMSKSQPEVGVSNTVVCNGVVAGWDVIKGTRDGDHYEDTMVSVMILDHRKRYRYYAYIRWLSDVDTVASIIARKILLRYIRRGWVTLQLIGPVIVTVREAEEMLDAILAEHYIDYYDVLKGE